MLGAARSRVTARPLSPEADGVSPTQVQPLLRPLPQTQQQEGESRPRGFPAGGDAGAARGTMPERGGHAVGRGLPAWLLELLPVPPRSRGSSRPTWSAASCGTRGSWRPSASARKASPSASPSSSSSTGAWGLRVGHCRPGEGRLQSSWAFWGAAFGPGVPHSGSWKPPAAGEAAFPATVLVTTGRVQARVPLGSHAVTVMVSWAHPGTAASSTCGPTSFPTGPTAWRC